jgi:hypothetical protein
MKLSYQTLRIAQGNWSPAPLFPEEFTYSTKDGKGEIEYRRPNPRSKKRIEGSVKLTLNKRQIGEFSTKEEALNDLDNLTLTIHEMKQALSTFK